MLCVGSPLMRRYLESVPSAISDEEQHALNAVASTYRARLHDLSWFARTLNESIAKMANKEDSCSGRFWEGRSKTQALLDQRALLAAMVYVDLNPIRAGMAERPEAAEHTSINERVVGTQYGLSDEASALTPTFAELMPFERAPTGRCAIPFRLRDYVELVNWTGRQRRSDKRCQIDSDQQPILERTGIEPAAFVDLSQNLLKTFGRAVGGTDSLISLCGQHGVKYVRGVQVARKTLG